MAFSDQLNGGKPIITLELSPPKGTDVSGLIRRVHELKGKVDAINVPDCQLSILKMSSMATAKIIQDETGVETVWQLTCRDRNLIALQADLMGGYALGLRNMLALTGDPVQLGDQKEVAKQVFHLESLRLLELLQSLNQGLDATGKELPGGGTQFTVGAAINPGRLRNRAQLNRLEQKIERGVQFLQSQPVYALDQLRWMMDAVREAAANVGCPPPKVLAGIIPPKSVSAALYMNKHVTGVEIPADYIERLEKSEDPVMASIEYCAERVRTFQSECDGFHFMPVGMASKAALLLDRCFALV